MKIKTKCAIKNLAKTSLYGKDERCRRTYVLDNELFFCNHITYDCMYGKAGFL